MSLITENKRFYVGPRLLTADGTVTGQITLDDSKDYRVGQIILLQSSTQPQIRVQIKRCLQGNIILVGREDRPITDRIDVSLYLVSDGAFIVAEEQNRSLVPQEKIERFTYEEEPIVARRVILVDDEGDIVSEDNPLPVVMSSERAESVNIVGHPNPIFESDEYSLLTDDFEVIFSYTSLDSKTYIMYIQSSINAPAIFKIKIGTNTVRVMRSSSAQRNVDFDFREHRNLLIGEVLTVEAKIDRRFNNDYEAFTSMEGYVRSST